ncbi:MAG: hypothetical protein ACRD20_03635 [Terriglobales bacterium]
MSTQKSVGRFSVESPVSYESFPLAPAEGELKDAAQALRRTMAVRPPGATAKRAVWIVHGMGQQVPFETLEQLAEGLISAAEQSTPGVPVPAPKFREVRVAGTVLQRVELSLPGPDAGTREVHLYECYWAPKTEGAVKLTDVVGFLWDGGTRGLTNFFTGFARALFGNMIEFPLSWRTPTYLLLTLGVLAALTVIDLIVVGVSALEGIGSGLTSVLTGVQIPSSPAPLILSLTAVAGIVCAVTITFGAILFLAEMSRPTRGNSLAYGRRLRDLTWVALAITVLTILAGAAIMALLAGLGCTPQWLESGSFQSSVIHFTNVLVLFVILIMVLAHIVHWRNISKQKSGLRPGATSKEKKQSEKSPTLRVLFYVAFLAHVIAIAGIIWLASGRKLWTLPFPPVLDWLCGWPTSFLRRLLGAPLWECICGFMKLGLTSSFWIWPFLFLISAVVRNLMVQFVGDVTAYISSNKIDRFDDLRKKIKAEAKESAGAVYLAKARDSDDFEYEKVAVVGHSLGSVIAYDTLNRLIADDALAKEATGITSRTCLFLTFGSPLDKIAFFFSVMGKNTRHIREQLAAVVQPMIQDYKNRSFPWVNVYSRNDIICGALDFYDLPGTPIPPAVENVRDEDALIPLVAHVEYWKNLTLWNRLLAEVTR